MGYMLKSETYSFAIYDITDIVYDVSMYMTMQIRLFLKKAHELSQEWGNIPVVLAGDFNSMPQVIHSLVIDNLFVCKQIHCFIFPFASVLLTSALCYVQSAMYQFLASAEVSCRSVLCIKPLDTATV